MPTINQLVRKGRKDKKAKSKSPALQFAFNSQVQRQGTRRPRSLVGIGRRLAHHVSPAISRCRTADWVPTSLTPHRRHRHVQTRLPKWKA